MAIDSAEKRRAASGLNITFPVVTPNASTDDEWRQQAAGTYSGIGIDAPAAPGEVLGPNTLAVDIKLGI